MDMFEKITIGTLPTARKEFLTFRLGQEEFGIEILKVQEIRSYNVVTRIPNSPNFVKGVINLRGAIVPILDLRMKFNLEQIAHDEFTVVVILNFPGRTIGVIVDAVSDVIGLGETEIQPAPEFSAAFSAEYLLGLATVEQRMIILVDIEKLMTPQDMLLANDVRQQAEETDCV